MYLQVKNNTKTKFNTIRTTKETLCSDIKRQGWNINDCAVSEIRPELVDTVYRGRDGKNIPAGTKQYKSRARSMGNLNKKPILKPILLTAIAS